MYRPVYCDDNGSNSDDEYFSGDSDTGLGPICDAIDRFSRHISCCFYKRRLWGYDKKKQKKQKSWHTWRRSTVLEPIFEPLINNLTQADPDVKIYGSTNGLL